MGHVPDINELACTVGGLCVELGLDGDEAAYLTGVIGSWAQANLPGFDWAAWKAAAMPERKEQT